MYGSASIFCRAGGDPHRSFLQEAPPWAGDWPQFRGPSGDGVSAATNLPTAWGGFDSMTWQVEIPGQGWSSPIVVGDRIWLTTAEPTALSSQAREKKLGDSVYRDYRDQLQAHSSVTCLAVEIAAATGEVLRTIELFTCDDPPPIHATNGYASPTPVSDGKRLVCHFGSLGTACLEMESGKVVWKQRFRFDEITGPGSSPALAGNIVILPCDGADEQFVVGLDIQTGQIAWKTPRPAIDDTNGIHRRAFSTPLVIEHGGRQQAIVPGAQWAVSYDPATGRELWRVNMGDCHAIIPRPVFRDGLVYVCTGYLRPQIWAIRVDGQRRRDSHARGLEVRPAGAGDFVARRRGWNGSFRLVAWHCHLPRCPVRPARLAAADRRQFCRQPAGGRRQALFHQPRGRHDGCACRPRVSRAGPQPALRPDARLAGGVWSSRC